MSESEQSEDLTLESEGVENIGSTEGEAIVEGGVTPAQEAAPDGNEGEVNEEGQGNQSKSQNRNQRRNRRLRESEARNTQLAEDNRKLSEKLDTLDTKLDSVINPPPPRPERIDFESESAYEDSLYDWRTKQPNPEPVAETAQAAQAQPDQPYQATPEQQVVLDKWDDSIDKAIDKYDDFDELVNNNNNLPITPIMGEAIMESEVGTEVVYYLAKNPKVAKGIAALGIVAQINEISELSKKFAKNVTSAPDPIEQVGKGQASSSGEKLNPLISGATFE